MAGPVPVLHFDVDDWSVKIDASNVAYWADASRTTSLSIGGSIPLSDFEVSGVNFTYSLFYDSGGTGASVSLGGSLESSNPFVSDLSEEFWEVTSYYNEVVMDVNKLIEEEAPGFARNGAEGAIKGILDDNMITPTRERITDLINAGGLSGAEQDRLMSLRDDLDGYRDIAAEKAGAILYELVEDATVHVYLPTLPTKEVNGADENGEGGITRLLPRPAGEFVDEVVQDTSIVFGQIADFMTDNGQIDYEFSASLASPEDIDAIIQDVLDGDGDLAKDHFKNPNNVLLQVGISREYTAFGRDFSVGLTADFPVSTINSVQDLADFNVAKAASINGQFSMPFTDGGQDTGNGLSGGFTYSGDNPADNAVWIRIGGEY